MDAVLRATAMYLVLLAVLRLSGKRTLAQITVFDFVLLLIISESTQQGLLGDDFSVTNAILVIVTLVALDRTADALGFRFKRVGRLLEGAPLVIVDHGKPHEERLRQLRISTDDILEEARSSQGIERMEQIKYAVLERSGSISVVPTS
jgi:uncharacterized membrane protein YcaP (DUF421 family)